MSCYQDIKILWTFANEANMFLKGYPLEAIWDTKVSRFGNSLMARTNSSQNSRQTFFTSSFRSNLKRIILNPASLHFQA